MVYPMHNHNMRLPSISVHKKLKIELKEHRSCGLVLSGKHSVCSVEKVAAIWRGRCTECGGVSVRQLSLRGGDERRGATYTSQTAHTSQYTRGVKPVESR